MDYSKENQNWDSLSYVEKNHQLYLKQKALLDQFLEKGAISQAQHDKELLGHRFDHTFAGICGICGIYGISGTHLFYIINIFPKISSFFITCFMGS